MFNLQIIHTKAKHLSYCQYASLKVILRNQFTQVLKNFSSSTSTPPPTNDRNSQSDESEINDELNLEDYPTERIRNFSIIAHVDHGKSTLADRLLEFTGTIKACFDNPNKQVLDKLQVERERGITVKAQTATMVHKLDGVSYLLNLIDTPGHVDFSHEVSRSLSASQGVLLLIDANQGIQAQTVANYYLALSKGLTIIPIINKIDLKNADPERVTEQLELTLEIPRENILKASAKYGTGISKILEEIIRRIPSPSGSRSLPARGLLFDSWYDKYKGAALLIALHDGVLKLKDSVSLFHNEEKKTYEIKEIGVLTPYPSPKRALYGGQVGYIFCNMRSLSEVLPGDTVIKSGSEVRPLEGFKKAKPMVFAGLYPQIQSELPHLRTALQRLLLNDPSVSCVVESSGALGSGWRLGFLGILHMDVFNQRLEQEYGTKVLLTSPNVPIRVMIKGSNNIKKYGGSEIIVANPMNLPETTMIEKMYEPFVVGTIVTPSLFVGDIIELCTKRRGSQKDMKSIDGERVMLIYKLPLNEIVVDFYDRLKSITSGYASFDYDDIGYEESQLTRLNILLNGNVVEEMTLILHVEKAKEVGKRIVNKLVETVERHQFPIAVQAVVGSKVVARGDIKPVRRDVTQKLKSGGDLGRKQKLLKRQAEGKENMKMISRIAIPREAFVKILKI